MGRNLRTVEGQLLHERCHDDSFREKRGDLLTVRGMRVISHRLRLTGACDVVEFRADPDGVRYRGRRAAGSPCRWSINTAHRRRTTPTACSSVRRRWRWRRCWSARFPAALFYAETHRRELVELTPELRQKTLKMAVEMNDYFVRGYTPKVKPGKHCNACSLKELCLPALYRRVDAQEYVRTHLEEIAKEGEAN